MPLGGKDEPRCSRRSTATSNICAARSRIEVNFKFAPEIRFRIDDTFDNVSRIDALLNSERVKRDLNRATMATTRKRAWRRRNEQKPIEPRRRRRLGGAGQACRHDLDAGGVAPQAHLQRAKGRPRRHARSARLGHSARRLRRGDQDRAFRSGRREGLRFTVRWGAETDTDDSDGRVVRESAARPERAAIEALLPQLHRRDSADAAAILRDQDRRRARL